MFGIKTKFKHVLWLNRQPYQNNRRATLTNNNYDQGLFIYPMKIVIKASTYK